MVGQVMAYDGRDPAVLQAEGQGFESPKLHRTKSQVSDTALTWDLIFPELFKASVPVTCPMEFRRPYASRCRGRSALGPAAAYARAPLQVRGICGRWTSGLHK